MCVNIQVFSWEALYQKQRKWKEKNVWAVFNCSQQFWGYTLNNKAAEISSLSVGLICCFSSVTAHTCYNPCWQTKFLPHLLIWKSLRTKCFHTEGVCFFSCLDTHISTMFPKHNHCTKLEATLCDWELQRYIFSMEFWQTLSSCWSEWWWTALTHHQEGMWQLINCPAAIEQVLSVMNRNLC